MATRYFASDVETFSNPRTGHVHRKYDGQPRMAVDCAACDPEMARYGAVTNPDDVPLTYAERRRLADMERVRREQAYDASLAAAAAWDADPQRRGKNFWVDQ